MAIQSSSDGMVTGINITPLVDVCLVLVIIFMVTAPLLSQSNLPVDLPKASTAEGKERENITLTITKDGRWALNAKEMPQADIPSALKDKVALSRDRYVIIRADKDARYALALAALKMAKDAGAADLSLATQQKTRPAR